MRCSEPQTEAPSNDTEAGRILHVRWCMGLVSQSVLTP